MRTWFRVVVKPSARGGSGGTGRRSPPRNQVRNYLYWYGAWVEFPVYGGASDDLRITWKGELSSAPENPERNWLYVTSVNRFLLLYTGEDWEEHAIINSLNKCGWCILGFSALSYHYYND